EKGNVSKVKLIKSSGNDLLDKASLKASKLCEFIPPISGKYPVAAEINIKYTFNKNSINVTFQ
ncbi:energy transducer TonB, partial [bacterium]|nr:energy transducer TonB [bacterium]